MWMCITGPTPPPSLRWKLFLIREFFYIRGEQNKNKQNFSEDDKKTLPARQSSLKLTCDASCIGQHRILHTLKISFAFFSFTKSTKKWEKFSSPSGVEVMAEEVNAGYFPSPHTPKTKHNISSSYVKGKIFRLCIHFPFTSITWWQRAS